MKMEQQIAGDAVMSGSPVISVQMLILVPHSAAPPCAEERIPQAQTPVPLCCSREGQPHELLVRLYFICTYHRALTTESSCRQSRKTFLSSFSSLAAFPHQHFLSSFSSSVFLSSISSSAFPHQLFSAAFPY